MDGTLNVFGIEKLKKNIRRRSKLPFPIKQRGLSPEGAYQVEY